jgi:chromosomal replication initiation ATPase DnaA
MLTTKTISPYCIPGLVQNKKFDFTKKRYTIEQVAEVVCKELRLTVAQLKLKTRVGPIVEGRQITGYICTKVMLFNYTSVAVGNFFGIDHATVLNGNKMCINQSETNKKFAHKLTAIIKSLDL